MIFMKEGEGFMIAFYIRLFITTLTVVLSAKYIPGLSIHNLNDAIIFGLVLGLVNAFLGPLLTLLTIPLNVLTLGFFSLFINAFTYWLASEISFGVHISSWKGALFGGALVWLISLLSNLFIKKSKLI